MLVGGLSLSLIDASAIDQKHQSVELAKKLRGWLMDRGDDCFSLLREGFEEENDL